MLVNVCDRQQSCFFFPKRTGSVQALLAARSHLAIICFPICCTVLSPFCYRQLYKHGNVKKTKCVTFVCVFVWLFDRVRQISQLLSIIWNSNCFEADNTFCSPHSCTGGRTTICFQQTFLEMCVYSLTCVYAACNFYYVLMESSSFAWCNVLVTLSRQGSTYFLHVCVSQFFSNFSIYYMI